MAIDQALLDLADRDGIAALRLYAWAPHCLSFGRHEPALRRYDRAQVEALGLDAVRRPTGGRAVWHADELTYAVAAPATLLGSLTEAYERIHSVLGDALRRVGLAPTVAPRPARAAPVDAGPCFAQAAGGELLVSGSKLVGSAQLRSGTALLQHGSILFADNQGIVANLSAPKLVAAGPMTSQEAVTYASGGAIGPAARAQLRPAIAEAAQRAWPGVWRAFPEPDAFAAAATRNHPQFRDPAWTWRR